MSNPGKPITVGSIIHLENRFPDGGYLDTRGQISDKPVITNFQDPRILTFVSTYEHDNRFMGSGSWMIHSAEGKAEGEPVLIGDKIYLQSMYSGAGYLDTFEWVFNLEPFKTYPMSIGVFTSSPNRAWGISGTWIVCTAAGDETDHEGHMAALEEGSTISLKNAYPQAGYLQTYTEKGQLVSDHLMFSDYDGQQKFVFTNSAADHENGSRQWTVSLSTPSERIQYYVWGNKNDEWLDFGIFKFNSYLKQSILALKLNSAEGQTLTGDLIYNDHDRMRITAVHMGQNQYDVTLHLDDFETLKATWNLGGRQNKQIKTIDVASTDNGRTFTGKIAYLGEEELDFKGIQATTTLVGNQQQTILYDFYKYDLWEGRIARISEALKTAVAELDDVLFTINGFTLVKLAELIDNAGGDSSAYLIQAYAPQDAASEQREPTKFSHLNAMLAKLLEDDSELPVGENLPAAIDFGYQVKQLLNIYTLWCSMDDFWKLLSTTSIEAMKKLDAVQIVPPIHRIRECFQQFTIDFEIVESAIQQRRWVTSEEVSGNLQAESLVVTDKLAAMSLAPFQHLLSDDPNSKSFEIVPITYFSKTIHIRQLPYTDQFILVGLTYDLTLPVGDTEQRPFPPFELMAIPHEIGHFMFHHAKLNVMEVVKSLVSQESDGLETDMSAVAASLKDLLKQDSRLEQVTFAEISQLLFAENPYYHWCEEIFADLYGCIVAGPFTALGLQALLATGDKERILLDDEDHPTPILRPFFLSEMLRELSRQKPHSHNFEDIATLLDANWNAILERWGFVTEHIVNGRSMRIRVPSDPQEHMERFINVHKSLKNVKPILEIFLTILLSQVDAEPWTISNEENELAAKIPWCQKLNSLAEYIQDMDKLIGKEVAHKKVPHHHLIGDYQLKPFQKDEVEDSLENENEYLSSKLFQNILEGWHDSGPS
ncbi:MAG: hypothetical protein KDE51_15590, partial [Anaerolineales bacterium]|nr:hypothetical protein [Anaerolineales bacterium]